ncbi:MAG: hypothetical protein RSE00_01395 [Clostridia bacterium]
MSKIWSFMLIFSIVIAFITGNVDMILTSIINSGKSSIENVLRACGNDVFLERNF